MGDAGRQRRTDRTPRDSADVGSDHRHDVRAVGRVVSRSADSDQSVGQRRALGESDASVSAHDGVSVAGGAHGACDRAEAREETLHMLELYRDFAENVAAVPVYAGAKSESERFPGAVETYSIEALMPDGKALQSGTSHDSVRIRESLRHQVRRRGPADQARVHDVVGHVVANARRDDHGARRRSRACAFRRRWRRSKRCSCRSCARSDDRAVAACREAGRELRAKPDIRVRVDDRDAAARLEVQRVGRARRAGSHRDRSARRRRADGRARPARSRPATRPGRDKACADRRRRRRCARRCSTTFSVRSTIRRRRFSRTHTIVDVRPRRVLRDVPQPRRDDRHRVVQASRVRGRRQAPTTRDDAQTARALREAASGSASRAANRQRYEPILRNRISALLARCAAR